MLFAKSSGCIAVPWVMALVMIQGNSLPGASRFVDQNSPSPSSPYTNWMTAASNIQDAIDVSFAGDEIIVTNGIYQSGGHAVYGSSMNRIAVTIPIAIRSVNGSGVTTIQGYQVPGTTNGDGAIRCAYLTNGASLSGFTITGGATRAAGDPIEQFGGGVLCESWDATISNCVIAANTSTFAGGGAYFGTFWDCIATSNTSSAVYAGILHNCVLEGNTTVGSGGAAGDSTLYNCIVRSNSASFHGGGVDNCHLYHCDLIGNRSPGGGGAFDSYLVNCVVRSNSTFGTSDCNLYNCTVVGNSGGTSGGFLYNSIVYYNAGTQTTLTAPAYSCAPNFSQFSGTITNAPVFISLSNGDFRLQSNSPCINAGNNTLVQPAAPVDSAGSPRTVGGTVDIGAFEFQAPGSTISYAWLQRFGLPTDGSVDFLDLDNDGHSTFQEWLADTNPTNAASVLRIVGITNQATGAKITWLSSPTKLYSLERATNLNLTQPFVAFTTINGSASNTTSFTDPGARGKTAVVYRVSTYR